MSEIRGFFEFNKNISIEWIFSKNSSKKQIILGIKLISLKKCCKLFFLKEESIENKNFLYEYFNLNFIQTGLEFFTNCKKIGEGSYSKV